MLIDTLTLETTHLLDAYGLAAIFVVMLLKETGIPVPIPSDLIMLAAAIQSAAGKLVLWEAFVAVWIAMIVGAWVQYHIVGALGRPLLYRTGRYVGLTPERLDRGAASIRKGGALAVGVSLATPGLRLATIPACGLARVPYRSFFPGLIAGSAVFLAMHFVIAYLAVPVFTLALNAASFPLLAFLAALFVIGLAGWMMMRRGTLVHRHGSTAVTLERLHDWSHASCPVCLVIGAVYYFRHLQLGDKG